MFEDDGTNSRPASLILLSDAQINENHGHPTFWESKFAQLRLNQTVARRSVEQTVFSDVLLAETVKRARALDHVPVVFLGDAMNMSCATEYERFLRAMDASASDWIALPGNHDGFYTGVSQPTVEEHHWGKVWFFLNPDYGRDRNAWDWVCNDKALPKSVQPGAPAGAPEILPAGVVELYTTHVLRRFGGSLEESAAPNPGCHERTWSSGLLRDMTWCSTDGIHGRRPPWQAFVVQRLAVNTAEAPVDVILLDSSVYRVEPCFLWCSDVGLVGGLGSEQRSIVQRWLDEDFRLGTKAIIMAHHPISDWGDDREDRKWLEQNVAANKLSLVVSAHTHNGCVRDPFSGSAAAFRELNIGSIIDYPSAYTRLWLDSGATHIEGTYSIVPLPPMFTEAGSKCNVLREIGSFKEQTTGVPTGVYASLLSQIRAEIVQAQAVMSLDTFVQSDATKLMRVELVKSLVEVNAAAATATSKCSKPFGIRALPCEQDTKVPSVGKTIQKTALDAQTELAHVEDSTEWKSFFMTAEGGMLGACVASSSAAPYWKAVTGSANRAPLSSCLRGNPYAKRH